jgi:hypothetical protein
MYTNTHTYMHACLQAYDFVKCVSQNLNNEVYAENFIHQQLITSQVNVVILHIIKIVVFKMLEELFIRATVDIS